MEKRFRIIFHGQLRPGVTPAQVRKEATRRFKTNAAQTAHIFSGARVILKQDLSAEHATLYQRALEEIGLVVSIGVMPPSSKAPQPSFPLLTPAAAPGSEPPAGSQGRSGPIKISDFERTHINLARAEALLNATDRPPAAPAPAPVPMPTLVPALAPTLVPTAAPESKHTEPNDDWLHASGIDRLERTQQRLADAEALLLKSPEAPLPSPARAARQLSRQGTPESIRQRSHFICSHCGTEHEIESNLELRVSARAGQEKSGNHLG